MRITPQSGKRWRHSAGLLASVIVCLLVTAGSVGGFMLWSTADADRVSLERQMRLAAHIIDKQLRQVPHDQQSVVVWDDAVANTRLKFDLKWVDGNLGTWMSSYFGHDRAFVLDALDVPIYAMDGGHNSASSVYDADRVVYERIVTALRGKLADGALRAFQSGESKDYPAVVELATISDTPAIVSALPISSDSGNLYQAAGTEFIHISVAFLDAAFADELASDFLLTDADFTRMPTGRSDRAVYPIASRDGKFIGFFEWIAYRPGEVMLNNLAAPLGIAFVVGALLVFLLLDRLWRSSTALEAGRLAAEHSASHDPLTGLVNRAWFDEALGRAIQRLGRDHPIAVLMLDLDRFKQVNDTLGHHAGDDLIRAVGQRLQELVGTNDVLARLGGDEFAILQQTREGLRDAEALSRRIVEAIGKPFDINGSEVFIGVSIGIVLATNQDTDRSELTRKGDIALYEAKSSGRNRFVVYEEAMNELLQNRHTIEAELREALKSNDQLSVAFQPLFAAKTGSISGAEALIRWRHPKLGQVSPAHFVPIAESAGLIEQIGDFVLMQALTVGARWPGRTIAVNISPTQLRNPRFPERVMQMLAKTGMNATDLELEITETILLDNQSTTSEALAQFRTAGVRIALDDFGTGYSSLNYLKRYPVDRIKIDRSFVGQLKPSGSSAAIVQAMVTLAHALRIEVTAEGVETHEQMKLLREMGCNTFQGFLLSAPVSSDVLEGKLRKAATQAAGAVPQVA